MIAGVSVSGFCATVWVPGLSWTLAEAFDHLPAWPVCQPVHQHMLVFRHVPTCLLYLQTPAMMHELLYKRLLCRCHACKGEDGPKQQLCHTCSADHSTATHCCATSRQLNASTSRKQLCTANEAITALPQRSYRDVQPPAQQPGRDLKSSQDASLQAAVPCWQLVRAQ